jgi:three-Cys-motif partner protein
MDSMAKDRWHDLCTLVEKDDGLSSWDEVGTWTEEKLYFWHRYLEITTNAMTNNPHFPGGLVYVDLFAGAGICTLKESGRRIPGSVLIAANTNKPFTRIIACEQNREFAEACETRLLRTHIRNRCHVLKGDCNELIDKVIDLIPERSLTLAFIDPKGLDAKFSTIEKLAKLRRVDIVALFADAYDITRNIHIYREEPNSKLDQVLGPGSGWREKLDKLPNPQGFQRKLFAEIYMDQLKCHLGYIEMNSQTISGNNGPLYSLIYASNHQLGLKFWIEALGKNVHGQKRLFM